MKRHLAFGLLLSLAFAAPVLAGCPTAGFTLEQTLSGYPQYVEELQTVDYDHDGKLDLVGRIAQQDGFSTLHSWRGVGDGTFEAAVSLGDTKVMDLQVINVNNDAYDDIVGVSYDYRIWVRLGNATGFNAAITAYTNYAPYNVHAGNFNEGIGNIDIVVSSLTSGIFLVYEGNGNGTFTEKQRVDAGGFSDWVTDSFVADFDNDGRFDVALSRRMSTQVEVWFRNLDGTFASPAVLPAGEWPQIVKAADFNEDGLIDLASVNWDDGTVDVFENLGSRAFSSRQILGASLPGRSGGLDSLHIVDVDSDSHLDIMAGGVNGNWATTFAGNGDGTFKSPTWFELPDNAFSIMTGNFDSDSDLEVAIGSYQKFFTGDYACTSQVHLYAISPKITSGYTAKFRAVVSGISASTPLPLGSVAFKEGATTLGTVNIDSSGKASLDYNGLAAGDHTITAVFSGNSTVSTATSASIVESVTNEASTTTITLGASTHGEPFNSTVDIKNRINNSVHWYYLLTLDGVTESEPRWSAQPLTLTLSAGAHTISAEYIGTTTDPASTSPTYTFTTAKHAVSVTRSGGDTTVRLGTAHTIQITVSATTSPTPTGSVTLYRGATPVGSGAIAGGIASITATLPRGSYEYTAVYSGDTNYLTGSAAFTLNVLANTSVVIDAIGLDSTVYIPAVVPNGTTSAVMYRRLSGTNGWSVVPSWTLASPIDDGSALTRGFLYDYRLDATVASVVQQSNIDSALLYTDAALTAGSTRIKVSQFTELRDAINALRAMAGLLPFAFDGTFGSSMNIRAPHVNAMRTAVSEARTQLGMVATAFTDGTLTSTTTNIRRLHITELRDAAR
jgi:hypothetical protein